MKPTPGPWKIDERVGCIAIYPENETFNCLALPLQNFIAYWSGYRDENGTWQIYEKDQANAHLIAAAPDLLEACRKTISYLQGVKNGKTFEEGDLVNIIQQAVSKAEGRE